MTATLDSRRERVLRGILGQTDGLIDLLLESGATEDFEEGHTILSLLLRMRDLANVGSRAFDEKDSNLDDMEWIVFGKVMAPVEPEPETTA